MAGLPKGSPKFCEAVDWGWGNDYCDVALADLIVCSRYENILRNTFTFVSNSACVSSAISSR